ncbi:CRM-domain containing factor CFM3, chloroplastic/mitochondrial-like [Wolffia australiana]
MVMAAASSPFSLGLHPSVSSPPIPSSSSSSSSVPFSVFRFSRRCSRSTARNFARVHQEPYEETAQKDRKTGLTTARALNSSTDLHEPTSRWSIKIPSQRTRFPWQEQQEVEPQEETLEAANGPFQGPLRSNSRGSSSYSEENLQKQERLNSNGEKLRWNNNTFLAEKTIPELELRRLRNLALRMKERTKVGPSGVNEALVELIKEKWREVEVVKLKFEGSPALHMKKTHDTLEERTGGIVIWRSGSSLVLYRGMTYNLPCVKTYTDDNDSPSIDTSSSGNLTASSVEEDKYEDINRVLDELGPRFRDWSGREPLPVDADLLPGVLPGYKPPLRLLPYRTRIGLKNGEMTYLRRLARSMPPHFALGRSRTLQGLARAMVKLWEKSLIAKIAIKRGVPNTSNDRMAEEIRRLTGGVLLSRNKEFIVFYRGKDFLIPTMTEVLSERQNLANSRQDEEEIARLKALASISSSPRASKLPQIAGTLAETLEAKNRWNYQLDEEERAKESWELTLERHASSIRLMEKKLNIAMEKASKAEKALAKVQESLTPAELPTDLETVTDEERSLYRKMGLKMTSFLTLGRREVFDGTVENMHLNWKHRELVKIIVKGKNFGQIKHIAISLEAESGGVLISVDKTTKGYAIILYRGKNYQRPQVLRPKNLLTRRQALARSIELQRREALKFHISALRERIETMKSELEQMKQKGPRHSEGDPHLDSLCPSGDDIEDDGEEAYLRTYDSDEDML